MSGRYDDSMLAAKTKALPESKGLEDTDDEWWIGMIAVPKSSRPTDPTARPSYRRGWTFALEEAMHFVSLPFTRQEGGPAIAIALRGANDDFFAAWFDAERSDEVQRIVDHLNAELDAERRRHPARTRGAGSDEVVVEIGTEHAPDSPHGRQRIQLLSSGAVRYERANRGDARSAAGRVDPSMWTAITAALLTTNFPAPPQAALLPGGAVVKLMVSGPRSGHVLFDYYDALKMDGYREVVGKLVALCDAIRTADRAKLLQLGYDGEVA